MKIEFIKRGAATRLILIFAGWSTDARYYNDCLFDGWDTAVVSDYRDLCMPSLPEQYSTVYIFAYSLGVAVASLCRLPAAVRIAINGSMIPVSDRYGIPERIYQGTHDSLDPRQLMKFHLRMAGDKDAYNRLALRLPGHPDIDVLKEELDFIRIATSNADAGKLSKFDRVYVSESDRIFTASNLMAFWKDMDVSTILMRNASHALELGSIVRACLPDTKAIGEGFARASATYKANATIQKEICLRVTNTLRRHLKHHKAAVNSVLEIGAGCGLLTDEWKKAMTPEKATFIDLTEMISFGAACQERYLREDAEQWLESSEETFDVILSASTIQWFIDPVRFIATVRRHLNPGGIGIISTFVKGNLEELDKVRPCPIIYRSESEYLSVGPDEWECWNHTIRFDSPRDMLMHLRLTGVSPRKQMNSERKLENGSSTASKLTELPHSLTYRPMILVVKA